MSRLYGPQFGGQRGGLQQMAKKAQPTEGVWEIHARGPRAKRAVRKIGSVEDLD